MKHFDRLTFIERYHVLIARWQFVEQFLEIGDVGDEEFCPGLIVDCEKMEEVVAPHVGRLYAAHRAAKWNVPNPETDGPLNLPPLTPAEAIDAAATADDCVARQAAQAARMADPIDGAGEETPAREWENGNPFKFMDMNELLADAARYRWLRQQPDDTSAPRIDVVFWEKADEASNEGSGLRMAELDAAIDKAIQDEQP